MSDEQAKEEYQKRLNERKAALEAARKDAADHQATARSKYEKFTESPKNPADILDIMQADHAEATKRRNEELMAAAQAAGGLVVPDVVGMAMDTASATKDLASFAASAGKKMATGERLSPEDWELAANGFASYTSAVGAAAKSTVGLPIGIAQVGFGLMNAGAAQWWAYGLEKGIEQTQRPLAENARLLRHQIDVETIRTQYFDRQLEQVNQEGRYFDLWRP